MFLNRLTTGKKHPLEKAVSFEVSEGDGEAEVGDKVPQADEEEEEEDEVKP